MAANGAKPHNPLVGSMDPVVADLSGVVVEATKRAYGKQGAAAAFLGKDEGNFSRDLRGERMTLRDLRALGPSFLAALGEELVATYGELRDPKDQARRTLTQIEAACKELRQYVESL